jgi:hypothetical protein
VNAREEEKSAPQEITPPWQSHCPRLIHAATVARMGFAEIIKHFDISPQTKTAVRKAGLPPRPIMRSAKELWTQLLVSPSNWRLEPQAYGIPAACQIFGRFVHDSGFEAILFPSRLGPGSCLAVFPDNFLASAGRVEVVGAIPDGATHTVLDKDHLQ